MDEFFYPKLSVRCNFDSWEEQGRPDMLSRAKVVVQELLKESKKSLLDRQLIARAEEAFPGIQNA